MTTSAVIRSWLDTLAAGGARPATIGLRGSQIRRLDRAHPGRPLLELEPADLAAWLGGQGWGPETLRSHRSALRSFYGWALDAELIPADPARRLRAIRPSVPAPRAAAENVVDAALAAADPRVHLMLMLASRGGLRRGEVAAVHSDHLVPDLIGWSLMVDGKGGRIRTVPLLDDVARLVRALPPGWAFPNGRGDHLTPAHTGKLMRRALRTATAHQLRHRYATRIYQATHDIEAVRRLLGHASVATTQRYIAVDVDVLRAAAGAAA